MSYPIMSQREIIASYLTGNPKEFYLLVDGDPDIGFFDGEFDLLSPKQPSADGQYQSMCWGLLRVGEVRRGHATRLVSALAYMALDNNVTQISGAVESQHTIKILDKLFGDDRVTYQDCVPGTEDSVSLPMTNQQAIGSLERAEAFEEDPNHRSLGVIVAVDLSGIDTAMLEKPTIENPEF